MHVEHLCWDPFVEHQQLPNIGDNKRVHTTGHNIDMHHEGTQKICIHISVQSKSTMYINNLVKKWHFLT